MKQQSILIFISLFLALFIYLFYRTEQTISNALFIQLFTKETYLGLKEFVNMRLELPTFLIYSLPGGLWVFAATLVSDKMRVKLGNIAIRMSYIPLAFALGLEIFQLIGIAAGTFDFADLFCYLSFAFLGHLLISYSSWQKLNWNIRNYHSWFCFSTYLSVFLAHVSV